MISARFLGNETKQHCADVYWVSQIPFCVRTKLYGIMWTYPKTVMSFDQHDSYSWGDLGIAYTVFSFRTFRPGNYTSRFRLRTFPLEKPPPKCHVPFHFPKHFSNNLIFLIFPERKVSYWNCITTLNFMAIYGKWEWVMLISKQWTQTEFSISKFSFFWPLSSGFARARGKLNLNPS